MFSGEHPRLGALDVCPFIPVANVTMEECAELSRRFGCRLATELSVPVYLYEYAVAVGNDRDYRRTLPQIREGEYERLRNKVNIIIIIVLHFRSELNLTQMDTFFCPISVYNNHLIYEHSNVCCISLLAVPPDTKTRVGSRFWTG